MKLSAIPVKCLTSKRTFASARANRQIAGAVVPPAPPPTPVRSFVFVQERSSKSSLVGGRWWLVTFAASVDARRSCQHGKGGKFEEDALHVDWDDGSEMIAFAVYEMIYSGLEIILDTGCVFMTYKDACSVSYSHLGYCCLLLYEKEQKLRTEKKEWSESRRCSVSSWMLLFICFWR